ncbi:hypothetical protein GCM10022237_44340 [Nocardioides ginsengisoli]|uniref:Cbb3-type cytochrome c oxidase subunit 3 n=1 Tax=Nocardioides ginsengisoli TaxID=363868 RepID=A0ABW3VYJ5_9ACTN
MDTATIIVVGVVIAVFIVGLLLWAFFADRKRAEQVSHDSARLEADEGHEIVDPTDQPRRNRWDR